MKKLHKINDPQGPKKMTKRQEAPRRDLPLISVESTTWANKRTEIFRKSINVQVVKISKMKLRATYATVTLNFKRKCNFLTDFQP